jgi:hypothetical protein
MSNVNLGNFYLSNQCQSVKSVPNLSSCLSVFVANILRNLRLNSLGAFVAKLLRTLRNLRLKTV